MPEKHVPKHRAPKRELFGRRGPVGKSNNNGNRSTSDWEPRRASSAPAANGAGDDPTGVSSFTSAKPPATDPGTSPAVQRAPAATGSGTRTSNDLFAPEASPTPVLSSEDYFDSLVIQRPVGNAPAPAIDPADRRSASDELFLPGRTDDFGHTDGGRNGSDLLLDPDRIQVKSAIRGGGQAWDPFLKDPEPETRRFRRKEPVSDLDKLKTRKKKIRPVRPVPAEEHDQHQTLGQWLKEIILLGLIAILTAVLLTNYVVQAFFIPSESMEDTLVANDRVLVNKLIYDIRDPRPGDIIVFTSPERDAVEVPDTGPVGRILNQAAQGLGLRSSVQDLIKRVVAVEGQTVEVKIGSLFVDGRQVSEPYRKDRLPMPDYGPYEVPEGHVFVMGDNRLQSHDSRAFGPVDETTIVGRAFALIWPVQRFDLLNP